MKDKLYNFFEFVSEYALYGLLFFIPISISLVEIFVGLIFLGFVCRKVIKPDFKFIKFWPNIFLLLFLFFNALSLLNSGQYFNKGLHALFGKWIQYLLLCIIIQDNVHDQKIIKRGIFVFLFAAALVVLSGLSQYLFGVEFLRHKSIIVTISGISAITSSFVHYNSLGAYLVVVLSLAGGMLLASNSFGLKAICLSIFSIFSTVSIILTFSRGSWIALTCAFIFMLILAKKNFKKLIPIFIVIIAMFLLPVFHDRIFLIFKAAGDSDRFRYWSTAFNMVKEHPFFGVGVGTFMANFFEYSAKPAVRDAYAHNCYLQIWAETGIFALASFVFFIVSIIWLGIKKFLVSKDLLLLGLLSGVVGFLAHSFFDTNMYSLQLAVLFWTWVGLIITRLHAAHDE